MRQSIFYSLFVLAFFYSNSTQSQTLRLLGSYESSGRPLYLTTPDVLSPELNKRINLSLPQSYSVPKYHPEYLSTTNVNDVLLKDLSDVWVTFVDEGAGYKNTLGFYTYDANSPLPLAPKHSQISVIFPNVSLDNNVLKKGDKVYLGRFPKNTAIGFVLVANAFNNGEINITGKNFYYTNPNFNPETDATYRQHSVLLRDASGLVVMGFEDLNRNWGGGDNDFNDAVFYVTAEPATAIFGNMPLTVGTAPTAVTSGNVGGLESDGCLASAIASRNFKRAKTLSVSYDNPENLEAFSPVLKGQLNTRGEIELEQFIPEQPFIEPVTARISTPNDLVGVTNAQKVLSVDYFDNTTQERIAAVLTTKTMERVYEHTKVICDRLIGSSLLQTEVIMIENMPFIRSILQRENGTFEYNISFAVAKESDKKASIISRWSVDEYPSKAEFWNYQVWAEAPHLSQRIVEDIIAKFKEQFSTVEAATAPQVPQVYIKNGIYDNGILKLTVKNPINASFITLAGNYSTSETHVREIFNKQITLSGAEEETLEVFVGSVFDLGFTVRNDKSPSYDALYFADGVWGLEYDKKNNIIDKYSIQTNAPIKEEGVFTLERNPILRGQVKDYVSLFRSIRPANTEANMSAYKNLSFTGSGSGVVEVTLIKKSITDWTKQYHKYVRLFNDKQEYHLPLNEFENGTNQPLKADDLIDVVFTIKGDGKTTQPFELSLTNVVFDNKTIKTIGSPNTLTAFPNPASESTAISFEMSERGAALVTVTNAQGQNMVSKTEEFVKGRNQMLIPVKDWVSGIYIVTVTNMKGKVATKILVP